MYDTIIVGAGVIGLAIAWRATEAGLSVLIVDRNRDVASEASRVAAGMLAPVTEAHFGENRLLELNLESARRYPGFVKELSDASGLELSLTSTGTIFVALDRDETEAMRRLYDFQTSLGLEVTWLGAEAIRGLEPAFHPAARAGIFAGSDLAVDPRKLTAALAVAVERAGGEIRRETNVTALHLESGRCSGIVLEDGSPVNGGNVVLAAGCFSGSVKGVPQEVAGSVRPVKGQLLRLSTRGGEPEILEHVVRTEEVYLVPRATGEVVVGATVEERGFDTTPTAGGILELLRAADEVIPGIRELDLVAAEAGLRPGTPDNAPMIGTTSLDGLVAATGHYRNGILLAPITADAIVSLIARGENLPEVAEFTPERFA